MLSGEVYKLGQIGWRCVVQHPTGIGAKLEFTFGADQSYLPDLIAQLTEVMRRYPVRGLTGG